MNSEKKFDDGEGAGGRVIIVS